MNKMQKNMCLFFQEILLLIGDAFVVLEKTIKIYVGIEESFWSGVRCVLMHVDINGCEFVVSDKFTCLFFTIGNLEPLGVSLVYGIKQVANYG